MKTANTRVRVKDIKQGVTLYTAHPVYGIRKAVAIGKPYMINGIGLFFDCWREGSLYGYERYKDKESLCDSGITAGVGYNGRRTFFKLKHAEAWVKKWATDKGFQRDHAIHEARCDMFSCDWDYNY